MAEYGRAAHQIALGYDGRWRTYIVVGSDKAQTPDRYIAIPTPDSYYSNESATSSPQVRIELTPSKPSSGQARTSIGIISYASVLQYP